MNTLSPKEVAIIQMALQAMIKDNEAVSKDCTIPFTGEARGMLKEINIIAKSALEKIAKELDCFIELGEHEDGYGNDLLTKES
jgi:hypothetical protein